MGDKSAIEWTDATWNPTRGCSIVSRGCQNCYAMRVAHRHSGPGRPYEGLTRMSARGPVWTGEVRLVPELLDQPLRWRKSKLIFVDSMSDLFHKSVPDEFIERAFAVMALSTQHIFQLLTKREERLLRFMTHQGRVLAECREARVGRLAEAIARERGENVDHPYWDAFWEWPPRNVWLGVSVEDQETADKRIPLLLQTPAAVRWLSCEPLIGPVNLDRWIGRDAWLDGCVRCGQWDRDEAGQLMCVCSSAEYEKFHPQLHWIVSGGESGPKARPMHPDWPRELRDQCAAAGVPFFFKQWGEWAPGRPVGYCRVSRRRYSHESVTFRPDGSRYNPTEPDTLLEPSMQTVYRVGKKRAGRLLDGELHDEYPRQETRPCRTQQPTPASSASSMCGRAT